MSPLGRRMDSGLLMENSFQGCFDLPNSGLETSEPGLQGGPASAQSPAAVSHQGGAAKPGHPPAGSCARGSSAPRLLSPPHTGPSWRLGMSECEERPHAGLCRGCVFAKRLGGEDCISRLFLNLDCWNLIWKKTKTK